MDDKNKTLKTKKADQQDLSGVANDQIGENASEVFGSDKYANETTKKTKKGE